MLNPKFFEELSGKISQLVASSPAGEFEKNARAAMTSAFARLDLVTREEFDVQVKVLARAREKIEALEARLAQSEVDAR